MISLEASTNDLASETNANTIVEPIWGLHQLFHEQGNIGHLHSTLSISRLHEHQSKAATTLSPSCPQIL